MVQKSRFSPVADSALEAKLSEERNLQDTDSVRLICLSKACKNRATSDF